MFRSRKILRRRQKNKGNELNENTCNKRFLHLDQKIESLEKHLRVNQTKIKTRSNNLGQDNPLQCSSRDILHSDDISIRNLNVVGRAGEFYPP